MTIDFKKLAEPFPLDQLDWRLLQSWVSESGPGGFCAPYVDARAIMNRLDQVVGPENWQTEFTQMQGGTLCKLSIRVGESWISKQDGSDETDTEPFKGGISKALVRAAVSWGIGRYLYDIPQQFAFFGDTNGKTKGARYAKFKDGSKHFWLSPDKLPAAFLPEGSKDSVGAAINKSMPSDPVVDDQNPASHEPERKSAPVIGNIGPAAKCDCPKCGKPMMIGKYPIKGDTSGVMPWYCLKCKTNVPRTA